MWVEVKDFRGEVNSGDKVRWSNNAELRIDFIGEQILVYTDLDTNQQFSCGIKNSINSFEVWREPKRWRAEKGGDYWIPLAVEGRAHAFRSQDLQYPKDFINHKKGHYFRTEEQALECARREIEACMKYHEEIGE